MTGIHSPPYRNVHHFKKINQNNTTYALHNLYTKEVYQMEAAELSLKNEVKNIFIHEDEAARIASFNEAFAQIINEQESRRDIYKPVSGI